MICFHSSRPVRFESSRASFTGSDPTQAPILRPRRLHRGPSKGIALACAGLLWLGASAVLGQCPTAWNDAGVPIADPQPAPPDGTPELTLDGIDRFVRSRGIRSVEQFLNALPPAMRKNYALVESSGTGLRADTEFPRVILWGSDARLMIALGSHPLEPQREVLDIAQLDDATGMWIFRSLDLADDPPTLSASDAACIACHGSPARPIWGTYPDWPGMFGAVEDDLTAPQLDRVQRLYRGEGLGDRFAALSFANHPSTVGYPITLPGRAYGYANTVFNLELGPAIAEGLWKRMKASEAYRGLREEILLRSYCASRVPSFTSTPAWTRLTAILDQLGAGGYGLHDMYRLLGLDPDNDLPIHKLAPQGTEADRWNVATDSLAGLIDLLILSELMNENDTIRGILASRPDVANGFSTGCFDNLEQALRYKIYQGWTLRTEARQAAREHAYDVDLMRSHQGIFNQATDPLCNYLMSNVAFESSSIFRDGFESGGLGAWSP